MIEHFFDEIKIPITEYYLFDEEGKTQFNLEYCNENTINKYFSLEINPEDEYKYDPSSDYYNDGCFPNLELILLYMIGKKFLIMKGLFVKKIVLIKNIIM